MTMVMEHGTRQYGGIGYEGVYQNHVQPNPPPHFNDGWSAQASSHPPPSSVYPTSVPAGNPMHLNHTAKREGADHLSRPPPPPQQQQQQQPTAISVSYSNIPVTASSMVPNGNYSPVPYGGSDLLVLPPDMPRTTTLEQTQPSTTASPMNSFPPATYASLDYAQQLHHQQSQPQQHHQQQAHHPHHPHPEARNLHPG